MNRMKNWKAIIYSLLLMTVPSLSYGQSTNNENDIDGDSIINSADNCSEKANLNQLDSDNDGFGNVCDADFDNNNIVNNSDFSLFYIKFSQRDLAADLDGDGSTGFGDIVAFGTLHSLAPGPGATEEIIEVPLATVAGRVVDTAGIIIPNSSVTPFEDGLALDIATTVDSDGKFSLELPAEKNLSLLVTAPNFANQVIAVYSPVEGGTMTISTTLIKRGDAITISDEGIATHVGGVGAAVTFDKADFVDDNGDAVIGDIQLTITPVDVSKPATIGAFPGSFSGVAEGDSEPSQIISLGTVEYNFTQNGNPVNLAPGKTAEVLLPIYVNTYQDGTSIAIGDEIPLWSLNEDTGIWLQEGHGEVVASDNSTTGFAMRAVVSHFTWWNVDVTAQIAYVEVTVLGESSGTATITATADIAWGLADISVSIGATTDRLPIPSGTEVCFFASLIYDSFAFSYSEEVCITANPGEVIPITLTGQPEGEIDVITQPIGPVQDELNVYAAVGQPVPVSILPLTAETSVTYSVTSGALPTGLSIDVDNPTAFIVGTPSVPGTYAFTVTASDDEGYTNTIDFQYFVQETPDSINLSFSTTENIGLYLGFSSGTATIYWGDATEPTVIDYQDRYTTDSRTGVSYARINHEYISPRAGSITVSFSDGYEAVTGIGSTGNTNFNFDVFALSVLSNLLWVSFDSTSTLTGNVSSIPRTVKSLRTSTSNNSSLTGDIANLPPGLTYLYLSGNSVSGDLSGLPRQLEEARIYGQNTITGDISSLPTPLSYLYLSGSNTVSGDISSLPTELGTLYLYGRNTVNGNINSLSSELTSLTISGLNEVSGDINSLHDELRSLNLRGWNTVTGDITNLPDLMTSFTVSGYNTISGNIDNLSSNLRAINLGGSNTVTGNVNTLKTNITSFTMSGANTVSGNIQEFSAGMSTIILSGLNTVSGDLGLLEANSISTLTLAGNNTVDAFNTMPTWAPTRLYYFNLTHDGGSAFDASEVDRLLSQINDSDTDTGTNYHTIRVTRPNDEAPTADSDTVITELEAKKFRVYTH